MKVTSSRLPGPKALITPSAEGGTSTIDSSRFLGVPSEVTAVAVEPYRRDLESAKRLSAFGFANGSIAIALAQTTSTLFILNGLGAAGELIKNPLILQMKTITSSK